MTQLRGHQLPALNITTSPASGAESWLTSVCSIRSWGTGNVLNKNAHDIAHYTKLLHIVTYHAKCYITYNFPPPKKNLLRTPPKFNLEPENDGFQNESPFPIFSRDFGLQVPCWISGVYPLQSPSHFFLTSPRFQPKNGPRDVDKALMQKINSVGCASSRLSSPRSRLETTFFGAVEIFGRKEHPRVFRKVWKVPWVFVEAFWGGNLCRDFLELFFFEIKLLENKL